VVLIAGEKGVVVGAQSTRKVPIPAPSMASTGKDGGLRSGSLRLIPFSESRAQPLRLQDTPVGPARPTISAERFWGVQTTVKSEL
jgi:hypothetical protein